MVWLFVCLYVSQSCIRFVLVSYYVLQINALSIIVKVYIERNNMEVELIRFRKHIYFILVYFCDGFNAISPSELKSCQWLCILSLGPMGICISWRSPLADVVGHSTGALACFFVECRRTV